MATLGNKSIRGSVSGAVRYINHPDKNMPPDGLLRASAYIRGDHSVERLYSRGYNGCSSNPDVAIQQFRACELLYRQKKAGAREAGLADGKKPIVAEHFFLSFPSQENVSYELQREIVDKLCATPLLRDFYATSNCHWNTDNDHSHILVCNTSKDGSRKLGMNNKKRNALRKELDRICVEHGLSIIDDPALRIGDPDREAFVRSCVGKVEVYVPADYKKLYNPCRDYDKWMLDQIAAGNVKVSEGVSKNRHCTQAEAYERWIVEQQNFPREKDKKAAKEKKVVFIREGDAKAARVYYWDPKYKRNGCYYGVRWYYDDGSRKPSLVVLIELLLLVRANEEQYFLDRYPQADFGPTNWKVQNALDTLRYREEQDVRTPTELAERITDVGNSLAVARQGLAYYTNAPDSPFARKKVKDLEEQIQKLKKDYHDLKFIENHEAQCRAEIERYFWENEGKHTLDDLINRANAQKTAQQSHFRENEKNSKKK